MLIDKDTPKEALLVVSAIDDKIGEDGKVWAEFYPVDSILALRESPDLLLGHPLLDLSPGGEGVTVMADRLRPALAEKLVNWCRLGYFIALRQVHRRGSKDGRVAFLKCKGERYLTKDELWWLESIAQAGKDTADKLFVLDWLGRLCRAAERARLEAEKRAKKIDRKARKRIRRQERKDLDY